MTPWTEDDVATSGPGAAGRFDGRRKLLPNTGSTDRFTPDARESYALVPFDDTCTAPVDDRAIRVRFEYVQWRSTCRGR